MLRLRHLRFRQQLVLLFVVGALLVTVIGSIAASRFASNLVEQEMRRQGLSITQTLGQNAKLAMLYESTEAAADAAQSVSGFPDIQVLEIAADSGALLYREESGPTFPDSAILTPAGYFEAETPDSWLFRLDVVAEQAEEWGLGSERGQTQEREMAG